MSTPIVCLSVRQAALIHFVDGKPWTSEERDHYFQCVDCITVITDQLDRNLMRKLASNGKAEKSEAARAAIAHGRKVLERELGIPADL